MTDPDARRAAQDYLAALTDTEAAAFIADARATHEETRAFVRNLFATPDTPTEPKDTHQ